MSDAPPTSGWRARAASGPVLLARAAAAQVAIEFVRPKHWIAQGVLAVLAGVLAWAGGGWWILFAVVVVTMLGLGFVYWVVLRIICRIGAPKHLRKAVGDVSGEIRDIFENLRLPTGVLSSVLFALRVARTRKSLSDLRANLPEAVRQVEALLDAHSAGGATSRP